MAAMSSRHADLLARLERTGTLPDPRWRGAFTRVARERYVPARIWVRREAGGGLRVLDRDAEPRRWADEVYADDVVVVQADDGANPMRPGAIGQVASSSASQPSLVATMLHRLDLVDGMSVLEIGTGTGYNAALLAARLGAERVVSVEYDARLAEAARRRLWGDGWRVRVVAGDGNLGCPDAAPYDRVLATCGFYRLPYAWVAQTRPGGVILLPWATPARPIGLLRLEVSDYGTAAGRFIDAAWFMWDRTQRPPERAVPTFGGAPDGITESATSLDPERLWRDPEARFALTVQVPRLRLYNLNPGETAVPASRRFGLDDGSGAWATVGPPDGDGLRPVRQYGPHALWEDAEASYWRWIAAGSPPRERFGVTVTRRGQWVWLDTPDSLPWSPPD